MPTLREKKKKKSPFSRPAWATKEFKNLYPINASNRTSDKLLFICVDFPINKMEVVMATLGAKVTYTKSDQEGPLVSRMPSIYRLFSQLRKCAFESWCSTTSDPYACGTLRT